MTTGLMEGERYHEIVIPNPREKSTPHCSQLNGAESNSNTSRLLSKVKELHLKSNAIPGKALWNGANLNSTALL